MTIDASIKKRLVIEYDIISGVLSFTNNDEMNYAEILGALEYTKWMVHKDWMEDKGLLEN